MRRRGGGQPSSPEQSHHAEACGKEREGSRERRLCNCRECCKFAAAHSSIVSEVFEDTRPRCGTTFYFSNVKAKRFKNNFARVKTELELEQGSAWIEHLAMGVGEVN
jgi:hypothetical protein